MARKRVGEYLKISSEDFSKMTKKELREAVGVMRDVANKRLKSIERSGVSSSAARAASRSGGLFSTKGKSFSQLRSEFVRAKNFLESETSTITGSKQTMNDTIQSLHEKGIDLSPEDFDRFFRSYEKLKEINRDVAERGLKYGSMREIASEMQKSNDSPDEIAYTIAAQLDQIYETEMENDFEIWDPFEIE